jgi:manganese efflux pump family protein
MPIINILGIAIALAMDAFAVAVATGIQLKKVNFRQTFRLSFHFGLFQALMPLIGWSVGLTLRSTIESYDHWVAFGLLAIIGFNMFREALSSSDDSKSNEKKDATRGMTMVTLSIATSIDALAVGFSMSVLGISIYYPALIIGIVAGLFTIIGLHLGKVIGLTNRISLYSEIAGSLVLWAIGFKILFDHGVFN